MIKYVAGVIATSIILASPAFAQNGPNGGNCGNGIGNGGPVNCGNGGAGGAGGAGGTGVGVGVGLGVGISLQQQQQMQNQMQNQGQSQNSYNRNDNSNRNNNFNANANANRNSNRNSNANTSSNTNSNGGNTLSGVGGGGGTFTNGGTYFNYQSPQIPVSTAWAPALSALAPAQCVLSTTASGGLQLLTVGASAGFGATTPYEECNTRETIKILGSLPPTTVIHGYRADQLVAAMTMQLSGMSKAVAYLNPPQQTAQVSPSAAPVPVAAVATTPAASSSLPANCELVQPGNYITCK